MEKKPLSLVERIKQLALEQKREEFKITEADSSVVTCPQCGAGRAKRDGLTRCAYCSHLFTNAEMADGVHIKKADNSR